MLEGVTQEPKWPRKHFGVGLHSKVFPVVLLA